MTVNAFNHKNISEREIEKDNRERQREDVELLEGFNIMSARELKGYKGIDKKK